MVAINMKVIVREYHAPTDAACIFSTWRNSSYYGVSPDRREPATEYFKRKTKEIAEILWDAKVRVACLEETTSTIVGYSVVTGTHLDWVYVKPDYREHGIGSILVPSTITSYPTEVTKIGRAILDKKKNKEN